MRRKAHGQVRASQIITTWGPGALLDLPRHSVIVGGLDTWPSTNNLDEIVEPRLSHKLQAMTNIVQPRLFAPPPNETDPGVTAKGIGVWRFPEWFIVQGDAQADKNKHSRRLVNRNALDEKGRFEGKNVVPTRFVRACPKGHVTDINWYRFVHGPESTCKRPLWLVEKGTSGDLSDLIIRCECGEKRSLGEATDYGNNPLGTCTGRRPWLGLNSNEECNQNSRLLIRTASNAYFPQVVSMISIPNNDSAIIEAIKDHWDDLQICSTGEELNLMKKKPQVMSSLSPFNDQDVLKAIQDLKSGGSDERPAKQVELDALLAVSEGFGDDVPIDPDFHARKLPQKIWRKSKVSDLIEHVIQVHRLREVMALVGFTRFEAEIPDIQGEYEGDVERAVLAEEPSWYPAVENRGEGIFIQLDGAKVNAWLKESGVLERIEDLEAGHRTWASDRKVQRPFPGGPYVLLHTLSHLLMQSLSMHCGYPSSSIRERIYADYENGRYGILLYTGSSDAEGTLGGLVQQARHIESHLIQALQMGSLCSNDPICAQHNSGESMEGRWLHGAACHGCTLVAETSCEMRNDYLDRALVVPVLGLPNAAFFGGVF